MLFPRWLPIVLFGIPGSLGFALIVCELRRPKVQQTGQRATMGAWAFLAGLGMVLAFVWLTGWIV